MQIKGYQTNVSRSLYQNCGHSEVVPNIRNAMKMVEFWTASRGAAYISQLIESDD